jgi:hypothetical protein
MHTFIYENIWHRGCIYRNIHRKQRPRHWQHFAGGRDVVNAIAGGLVASKAIAGGPVAGYGGPASSSVEYAHVGAPIISSLQ